ncbi:hypothetical protein NMG60_11006382 [Bertholletia excelsa]
MNGASQAACKAKHLLGTTRAQCDALLRRCSAAKSLTNTKTLHAYILRPGLIYSPQLLSLLAGAYVACGQPLQARKLFDEFPDRTLLIYNAMIRACTENELAYEAIKLFAEMLGWGNHCPDKYTFPYVIKACRDLCLPDLGFSVHGLAVTTGAHMDTFVCNSLLAMYMNRGEKEIARRVFDMMLEPSVVSWNTMISGYYHNGCAEESWQTFKEMVDAGVKPDTATLVSVLPACGHLKDMNRGRKVHQLLEDNGVGNSISVRNALLDMYVKCGSMTEAQSVFDKMSEKDVVTWTTMINGYILNDSERQALMLCPLMQIGGVIPNSITMSSLLSACANSYLLKYGRCLHGWALRQKLESDVSVETALIDMYAKCNCIGVSYKVFLATSRKRTLPWNAILSGLVHNGFAAEAIELFKEMLSEAAVPDSATFNCLLPAYATLADFQQAMNIHSYLVRSGFLSKIEIVTGLIDIYCKCGSLDFAHNIFNGIPPKEKDIVCWSALLAGYGIHGNGKVAVSLFHEMVRSGVEPNEVTFTSVLHACGHCGLVDEGLGLFKLLVENHQTRPRSYHYSCIVDLLGRTGRLEEAYNLVRIMPSEPSHAAWGALLGACVIHGNVEIGELAAKWLFNFEPENTGNYVLLAKIYAAAGRWKDAENTRCMLNEIGLRKAPGHSLIEVRHM